MSTNRTTDTSTGPPATVLRTRRLTKTFGGFRAVGPVDLDVTAGTVHALVGPNGAGKTTLFNLLTGFLRPSGGSIEVAGRDVTGLPPERIARLGVARSFQTTSLFERASCLEHLELALLSGGSLGRSPWRSRRTLDRFGPRGLELLDRVGLAGRAHEQAGSLPYGRKRALELALALALDPHLLLLDEPTAGMGVEDVERTVELIGRVRAGRTVVMVEHNMSVVGTLADRVTVLRAGEVLADGPYEAVRADPAVIEAYLGADHA